MISRRSILSSFLGATAAAHVPVTEVNVLDAPAKPKGAIAVISTHRHLSQIEAENLRKVWESTVAGTEFQQVKAIVLQGGLELEIVTLDDPKPAVVVAAPQQITPTIDLINSGVLSPHDVSRIKDVVSQRLARLHK